MLAPHCTGHAKLVGLLGWLSCGVGLVSCSEAPATPTPNVVATCLDHDDSLSDAADIQLTRATEHLDIFVSGDQFMCAGTAVDLERSIALVSDQLDVEIQRRIPFYYDFPELAAKSCGSGLSACTSESGRVFATPMVPMSSYHELVHGIVCETRFGAPAILAEGLANALEPKPNSSPGDPTEFAEIQRGEEFYTHYAAAGHFVRWLHGKLGAEAFMNLYATAEYESGVWAAIEAAYGVTANADYLAQAPALWVPHRQCADLPLLESSANAWTFELHFDCDDPATMGPYARSDDPLDTKYMYQSFLIDVETPGLYRFERPDWQTAGFVQARVERCLDEHPMTQQEIDEQWVSKSIWFDFQHVGELEFTHPGLWRVDVLREFGPPADVWLTIELQGA